MFGFNPFTSSSRIISPLLGVFNYHLQHLEYLIFQPTSALGQVGVGQPQLVPGYCLLFYCSWRSFFGAETRVNTGRDLTAPHRTIPHPPQQGSNPPPSRHGSSRANAPAPPFLGERADSLDRGIDKRPTVPFLPLLRFLFSPSWGNETDIPSLLPPGFG